VIIGKWVGEFDSDRAAVVLSGQAPFDEATMLDDTEAPTLAEHPLGYPHPVTATASDRPGERTSV
jgi:aerobic C4-dicarboxylate transport protein